MSTPSTTGPSRRRVFGPFAFDEASGELTKHGVRVRLQGQPLQILAILLEEPGRVVTREEFQEHLWKGSAFGDFDHGLNAAMNRLRQALGDSADQPRYVETLPGKGYRFVAPTQDVNPRPLLVMSAPASETVQTSAPSPDRLETRELRESPSEAAAAQPGPKAAREPDRHVRLLIAAAALVGGSLLTLLFVPRTFRAPRYRYTPFATESMDEKQPAWSPDGKTLAYIGAVNGSTGIFTRGINSPAAAHITLCAPDCSTPFWSPDGTRVYYQAQQSLWSVVAVGGAPQMVVSNIAPTSNPASISPDGKTLAFFRREGSIHALYLLSPSGGIPRRYERPPFPATFRFGDGVRFSPDGRKLLVAVVAAIGLDQRVELWILPYPDGAPRRVPLKAPLRTGPRGVAVDWTADSRHCTLSTELAPGAGSHIYLADTDSGDVQPLTSGTGEESEPAVSRDGQRIAFSSGGDDYDLMEISLDGSVSPLLATSRQEHSASWSPSGRQYAYISNAAGTPAIWLRTVGENSARPIVDSGAGGHLDQAQPRFSPDGQRIAYVRMGDRHAVWISNISGGTEVPLEHESSDQHGPAWSPDGNWIAYSRFFDQKWQIAKVPSGGGRPPVRITAGGGSDTTIEWTSSGEWVCFRDSAGIHLVAADGSRARLLHGPAAAFALSQNGHMIYVADRGADRSWMLTPFQIPGGQRGKTVSLGLSSEATITALSLNPDGQKFAASLRFRKRDIWILDGFDVPHGFLDGWWSH